MGHRQSKHKKKKPGKKIVQPPQRSFAERHPILSKIGTGISSAAQTVGNTVSNAATGAKNIVLGQDPKALQYTNFTPEQQQAILGILQQGLGGLNNLGMQENLPEANFEPFAQQARMNFGQQTIPGIAERFSSLGAGSQGSSAFGQQLGGAASQLEAALASLGSSHALGQRELGLKEQGIQQDWLKNLLGIGLNPTFQTAYQPRQPGLLEHGVQAAVNAAPTLAKWYLGIGA